MKSPRLTPLSVCPKWKSSDCTPPILIAPLFALASSKWPRMLSRWLLKLGIERTGGELWLHDGKVRLLPPRHLAKAIEDLNLTAVTLGIRPQHWEMLSARPQEAAGVVKAKIGLFEIRNYKGVIRADGDSFNWLVLCDTYRNTVEGSVIWLRPKWDHVLFFDESDERIAISVNGSGGNTRGNLGVE